MKKVKKKKAPAKSKKYLKGTAEPDVTKAWEAPESMQPWPPGEIDMGTTPQDEGE